ncbi:hypothetical protein TSUD_64140, partial [Trifolium subterraneum]
MESRVLSRATTLSSLPRLNKFHREHIATNASLLSVKSIGSVSDGGNLVWGRQLRPELCSPAIKKGSVLLRPCLAAADGKDSAGEEKVAPTGFFSKYPALVTGFFFFTWYFLNPIDANLLKLLIPVAVCHALGHVTSNVSFAAVAVSFTHTIKALEPFFNAAASQFILGQSIPITLWLSLAPVVLGVSLASLTELSFNWLGFISAMISNISFTYRSIYSKKAMTDMDSTNIYAYISIIALIVCIPPALILEGPTLLKSGFSDAIAQVGLVKFVSDLFWVGNKISTQTGIGTAIAIAGVALYSFIKAKIEEEKR